MEAWAIAPVIDRNEPLKNGVRRSLFPCFRTLEIPLKFPYDPQFVKVCY